MTISRTLFAWALFICFVFCAPAIYAEPIAYFHSSDDTCEGNSPCYDSITDALQNVDDGGTVIFLSDFDGSIRSTEGRQFITLRGMPSTVKISSQILIEEVVTGWTIRDLEVTNSCVIQDVEVSLTIDNVTANIIKVGSTTKDTDATITFRNNTVRGTGPMSVIGSRAFRSTDPSIC